VAELDAAVEDAHLDPLARRAAEFPFPVDTIGKRVVERDARHGLPRERPGGAIVVFAGRGRVLGVRANLSRHAIDLLRRSSGGFMAAAHVALDLELARHVRGGRVLLARDDFLEGLARGRDCRVGLAATRSHGDRAVPNVDVPLALAFDVEEVRVAHPGELRGVRPRPEAVEENPVLPPQTLLCSKRLTCVSTLPQWQHQSWS